MFLGALIQKPKNSLSRSICTAVLLCTAGAMTALAAPSIFPTGVTIYDPSAAYNCDVLFNPGQGKGKTYLIDMNGHVLHTWNHAGFPSRMLNPARNSGVKGEIGVQLSAVPNGPAATALGIKPKMPIFFRNQTIGYVSWSDKILWQWGTQAPGGAALQHHDWARLRNGDTLVLANHYGKLPGFGDRSMLDGVIYEVTPAGKIIWSWHAFQHLTEFGFTPAQLALVKKSPIPDYLHLNDMEVLGPNHWAKSGDKRFAADNILISSRNANFLAIISRKTGNVVWRMGPNFKSSKRKYANWSKTSKPFPVDGFSGQHDAHLIPEGLPGAGDILVFDNEGEGGFPTVQLPLVDGSRVLEINPISRQVVWEYAGSKDELFSSYISSVQRLPNGNTLVDEGMDGRIFQVTPQGKIVWEYVSPYARVTGRTVDVATSGMIYRAQAVPYSWVPLPGPHSQVPVTPPAIQDFHIAPGKPSGKP